MIDEEEPTGLGASDNADGDGAACGYFSGELLLSEWVLLPLRLIGAFAVTYGYKAPVIRKDGELL